MQSFSDPTKDIYQDKEIKEKDIGKAPVRKKLVEVEELVYDLQVILNTPEQNVACLYAYAWKYPRKQLIKLANEAVAKSETPSQLFGWFVKEKLGYEPKGQKHGG